MLTLALFTPPSCQPLLSVPLVPLDARGRENLPCNATNTFRCARATYDIYNIRENNGGIEKKMPRDRAGVVAPALAQQLAHPPLTASYPEARLMLPVVDEAA